MLIGKDVVVRINSYIYADRSLIGCTAVVSDADPDVVRVIVIRQGGMPGGSGFVPVSALTLETDEFRLSAARAYLAHQRKVDEETVARTARKEARMEQICAKYGLTEDQIRSLTSALANFEANDWW